MVSSPLKAATSMNKVDAQVEIGQHQVDGLKR